jgi:hypothetical protein
MIRRLLRMLFRLPFSFRVEPIVRLLKDHLNVRGNVLRHGGRKGIFVLTHFDEILR